jgi:predicted nucleotidyltransferase component of viral defense system
MKDHERNIIASIQKRLKNEAERQGKPYAEILQYYAMERFLFRLSKTKYASKFILKGGLLFYVWNVTLRRPTKDLDFRGYVENSPKSMLQVIKDVLAVSVPKDGITFDLESINAEQTQIDADYEGVRVKFSGNWADREFQCN